MEYGRAGRPGDLLPALSSVVADQKPAPEGNHAPRIEKENAAKSRALSRFQSRSPAPATIIGEAHHACIADRDTMIGTATRHAVESVGGRVDGSPGLRAPRP